jgi:hypothetical protein
MRLTNSARQEAGLFQNIQTVPLCWNGAESLLAVAAGSRGHLTASPAMVTGAVSEMPSTLPPAVRGIGPHLAPCPRPAKGSWHAATHGAPSRAVRGNVSQAPHHVLGRSTASARPGGCRHRQNTLALGCAVGLKAAGAHGPGLNCAPQFLTMCG